MITILEWILYIVDDPVPVIFMPDATGGES
jgi:hypothetical protein